MRRTVRQRIAAACAGFLAFGCGFAYSTVAVVQSVPDIIGLPWMQIAAGALIALWGGGTSTLGRYLTAQVENKPFNWKLEVFRDVWVSVTVGTGAYFAGAWYGLGPMQLGLALLLSGLLGLRLITIVSNKFMSIIASKTP